MRVINLHRILALATLLFLMGQCDLIAQEVHLDTLKKWEAKAEWTKIVSAFEGDSLSFDLFPYLIEANLKSNNYTNATIAADEYLAYVLDNVQDGINLAIAYYWKAELLFTNAEYKESLVYYNKANRSISPDTVDPIKYKINGRIANLNLRDRNYEVADSIYRLSAKQALQEEGEGSRTRRVALWNLAYLNEEIGSFDKALAILEADYEGIKVNGQKTMAYPAVLINMARVYGEKRDYAESLRLNNLAIQSLEDNNWTEHVNYANAISNNSYLLRYLGRYEEALKNAELATKLFRRKFNKNPNHPAVAATFDFRGDVLLEMGRYQEAEEIYLKGLDIRKANDVDGIWDYGGMILKDLARLYTLDQKPKLAEENIERLTSILDTEVEDIFKIMSENEREKYYARKVENMTNWMHYVGSESSSEEYLKLLYSQALKYKGLQLKGSKEMLKAALNNENEEYALEYNNYLNVRDEIKYEELKRYKDSVLIDGLITQQEEIERRLSRTSSFFGEFLTQGAVSVSKVQDVLADDEIAMEFVRYDSEAFYPAKENFVYVVNILSSTGIEYSNVFSEEQLAGYLEDTSSRGRGYVDALYGASGSRRFNLEEETLSLFDLIWKPIEKYVQDANVIYYSPAGLLHKLNIGAIKRSDGTVLADHHKFVPLLSTGSIMNIKARSNYNPEDAYILGGVEFNEYEFQNAEILNNEQQENEVESSGFSGVARAYRNETWPALNGSEREVLSIDAILTKADIDVQKVTGTSATEESFKYLGTESPSPSIIHLSTHGFFLPDLSEEESVSKSNFAGSSNPMLRSGVLFAGGNQGWLAEEENRFHDDGVLTAYEIANMNLSDTKLLVLSGCETGLGDVKGSEGVYGLQRAFKKAGVRNMIISLWQIDDGKTASLMRKFYDNWLVEKMTIRAAFDKMQSDAREDGDDVYLWGGLMLIE